MNKKPKENEHNGVDRVETNTTTQSNKFLTLSYIFGESLFCIKKSLELAAKYVTVLYRMH